MKGRDMPEKKKTRRQQVIEDLENQLDSARKGQASKLEASHAHVVAQLELASEKYLTVNGYMQARSTIEQAAFGDETGSEDFSGLAASLAVEMSELAATLAGEIKDADIMKLDSTVLEDKLDRRFVEGPFTLTDVVRQLLVVNLLQNVGPVIDDIVSFRASTEAGIEKLVQELEAQQPKGPKLESVPPVGGEDEQPKGD